jgi:hypothetical protein
MAIFTYNFRQMKNIALIILALGLITGCKKKKAEEEETPAPINTTPTNPPAPVLSVNIPADADGVLMASEIPFEFGNGYITRLGKASAFFYTAPGNYNYVDAGTVSCKDSVLVKTSGSYYFGGKPINGQPFSGINFGSGSTWSVTGTSSVPAFTFATTTFPTVAALTSGTLISKNSPYNATYSGVANADSVVIILNGDSVFTQKKTVLASSGTCTFTAAEIGQVKKMGSVDFPYLHIISYSILSNTVSTKKYYMVNSNTSTYRINTF